MHYLFTFGDALSPLVVPVPQRGKGIGGDRLWKPKVRKYVHRGKAITKGGRKAKLRSRTPFISFRAPVLFVPVHRRGEEVDNPHALWEPKVSLILYSLQKYGAFLPSVVHTFRTPMPYFRLRQKG